jgi:transformation/transcription domain-associated protein
MRGRANGVDHLFKNSVNSHIDHIVKRAEVMACKIERESVSFDLFFLLLVISIVL